MFAKPSVDSSSGHGCLKLNLHELKYNDLKEILLKLGKNYVIQKCIECSEDIKRLNPSSVNTFRIITYRWHSQIYHMPPIMRIGRAGSSVDNAHAGGMFIGITDEGELKNTAYTEFKDEFIVHPDSGLVFDQYKIEGFSKVLDTANKIATAIPEIGVINWDFTLDKSNQPILIEANIGGGSIWLTQMANGCGGFEDNTVEILEWMKKMRRLPVSKYINHMCGE